MGEIYAFPFEEELTLTANDFWGTGYRTVLWTQQKRTKSRSE